MIHNQLVTDTKKQNHQKIVIWPNGITSKNACYKKLYMFSVKLSRIHPVEQPQLSFQSVYHEDHKHKPYQRVIPNYPYSPRWSGNEMAERTRFVTVNILGA